MAYFINNPINHTVRAASLGAVTFHRVIAKISIGGEEYVQSMPVSREGQDVYFDISSSIRAYVESIHEDQNAVAGDKQYNTYGFSVTFTDEYMKDGKKEPPKDNSTWSGQVAISGGYTDMERLRGASATSAETASYTLRPASPMLVPSGHDYLCYRRLGAERIACMRSTIPGNQMNTYHTGNLYEVPNNGRWTAFQFVNSRGLHETAFAQCYSSEQIKGGMQTHVRALRETFNSVTHRLAVPDPANAALSFSSGFVDLAWAKWWAYEFCKARKVWMLYDGLWLPCQVTIKDGASIINRAKVELLSVEFDVVPDVNGMI